LLSILMNDSAPAYFSKNNKELVCLVTNQMSFSLL
jgi:hypothetical protein